MQSWLFGITSLGWLASIASGNGVSIWASHDTSPCEKPSTARIEEVSCEFQDFECLKFDNVGGSGNVTYYGGNTCSSSRDTYLQSAFGGSPIFMVEYYADTNCEKLVKSEVYRADGQCHFFTFGVMNIWVAEDKSMAAVLSSSYCASDDWNVVMGMNVSVNTGSCFSKSEYLTEAVKYVLIEDPVSGPFSSKLSVYAGHDDPLCKDPSTARIEGGGCNDTEASECVGHNGVGGWGNVTYYGRGLCTDSREEYLKAAFVGSPVFMVESYEDSECKHLKMTEVYKADGRCHYFTLGVMKVWISDDNSKATLLTASSCESDEWSVSGTLSVNVNTGACIQQTEGSTGAEKYILVSDPAGNSTNGGYGRSIWFDRDESLCTHQSEDDLNACRMFTLPEVEQRGILRLLDLCDELLRHDKGSGPMPMLHPTLAEGSLTLPELLLQYLVQANGRLFDLWKSACIEAVNSSRPKGLEECQCVHEQFIHGMSIARRLQRLTGQFDLDMEWCNMLLRREEMLFQQAESMMSTLCGTRSRISRDQESRAYLDSVLC